MSISALNEVSDYLGYSLAQPSKHERLLRERFPLSLSTIHHGDAYTKAATKFYSSKEVKQLDLNRGWFEKRPRLVLENNKLRISEGWSPFEKLFYMIFNYKKVEKWEKSNQKIIDEYKKLLIEECGSEKVQQIEKTYGFNFEEIANSGKPLEPRHVYWCNIGMNNIEDGDVQRFYQKIQHAIGSKDKPDISKFTKRELRALEALFQKKAKDFTFTDFEKYFSLEDLNEANFSTYKDLLKECLDKAKTGRDFDTVITGSYNDKVFTDRDTFRPWVDQQELLEVFPTLKDPFPGQNVSRQQLDRFFFEMLTKVVVKKHLMRKGSDGTWRVGAMIPSPYKNEKGETIYYRVEQGVDSGFGKFWYVFRPMSNDPSLPVIRAPRDTSKDGYAQRGRPTVTRDLSATPGYLYANSTKEEDATFFKEFTLPTPLAYFALIKNPKEYLSKDREALKNLHERFMRDMQDPEKSSLDAIYLLFDGNPTHFGLYFDMYVDQLKFYYSEDDWKRFEDLQAGKKPRPFASIGNSLGGFDAAYDVVANTAKANRVPISDLQVYTHSSLKISNLDNAHFTSFIGEHKPLLDQLKVKLSIDHVTEKGDPVTLYPTGTLLGNGLKELNLGIPVELRIFIPKSAHPQLSQAGIHMRRIENLKEGSDYITFPLDIQQYDEYGREETIAGITLEDWHDFITTSEEISKLTRTLWNRGAHVPVQHKDDTLIVSHNPNGSSDHKFVVKKTN